MLGWVTDLEIWASLLTLTALEIVLGIDNVIFIALVASRLPQHQQRQARQIGLGLALITRLALLASITWIASLTQPVLDFGEYELSWRDLVLLGGGLFLLAKGTGEIHTSLEGEEEEAHREPKAGAFAAAIGQIVVLDIVFSLDSVITAVGMSQHLPVMAAAVIIAVIVMLWASGPIAAFVQRHPTVKMLALSFLLLVGVALVADGLHFHIPRGYLYFAIAFSVMVESLNLMVARRRKIRLERRKAAARDAGAAGEA